MENSDVESERIEKMLFPNDYSADLPWQVSALCYETDPMVYFPKQNSRTIKYAKRVCDLCPVQTECLNFAINKNIRCGIWGGLTENERRKIKKKRNEAKQNKQSKLAEISLINESNTEQNEKNTVDKIRLRK